MKKKSAWLRGQAPAALLGALLGVVGTVVGAIIPVIGEVNNLAREVSENKQAAETLYKREIGTAAATNYVAVLIEAENLFSRALIAGESGVSEADTTNFIGEIDAIILKLETVKAPMDLVATGNLRKMTDLSMDLYGLNGGDLRKGFMDVINEKTFDQENKEFGKPKGDPTVPPMGERLTCAENAGRIVFTETAQQFLKLVDAEPTGFDNSCYTAWLTNKDKWHEDVLKKTSATATSP